MTKGLLTTKSKMLPEQGEFVASWENKWEFVCGEYMTLDVVARRFIVELILLMCLHSMCWFVWKLSYDLYFGQMFVDYDAVSSLLSLGIFSLSCDENEICDKYSKATKNKELWNKIVKNECVNVCEKVPNNHSKITENARQRKNILLPSGNWFADAVSVWEGYTNF